MRKNIEWLRREVPNLRGYAVVIDDEDGKWEPITTVSVKDVLELINQLDEPEVNSQIDKLANFIMSEVEGEPNQNQGAVDTAIRIIRSYQNQETLSQEWIDKKVVHVRGLGDIIKAEAVENLLVPKQEEITHKQVEKYLLDKNIRVIDIDIYEEMQSELEELKNGVTLSKTKTVADVISDFWKSFERLKEVMSMEVEEEEE